MHAIEDARRCGNLLTAFQRTRYFYGQLLDVEHFTCEQRYGMGKQWLLNRFVSGYGVVCGLDVQACRDGRGILVTPGLALDQCGREIVVPAPSAPVALPRKRRGPGKGGIPGKGNGDGEREAKLPHGHGGNGDECKDDHEHLTVCLCYHECESDPTPTHTAECDTEEYCVNAKVQERYRIVLKPGKAPPIETECPVVDLVAGGRINYPALAIRVTQSCPPPCDDPCIPLANVRLPLPDEECCAGDIDITIRPIVYTNDLLWELLMGLTRESQHSGRGGKI